MISKIRIFFSSLVILFVVLACQEDLNEINYFSEESISSDSDLSNLISLATLKDGSFDNIIDNASALSIDLPIDVIANGVPFTIATEADFEQLEAIYNEQRYLPDSIQLVYPITGQLADYTSVTIESEAELQSLVDQSIEGGEDEDIECYRFNYPLSVSIYDTQNQRAKTEQANSDQELFELFNTLSSNHLTSLSYPIQLTSSQNESIEILSNSDLESLLSSAISLCDEGDETYYKPEDFLFNTSTLRVELTDAPFPFDFVAEANVTIDRVELKKAEGSEEDEFIILSEEEFSFNLLELTNGITATLVDMEVPEGSYDQIRLRVVESSVLLTDDRIFDLSIPSGSQSGIKVNFPSALEIQPGTDSELLLDFDVSRSFKAQGNTKNISSIKGFIFTPVVKATQPKETGELIGNVTDILSDVPIEGVQLSVFAADTLNTTTFSNAEGDYMVMGLLPGTYVVTAEYADYLTETVEDIEILIGEKTKVDFALTLE